MSPTSSENPQSAFRFNIFQGQLGLSEVKLGSKRHGWSKYIKYTYVSSQNFVQGCKIGLKTDFVIWEIAMPLWKTNCVICEIANRNFAIFAKIAIFPR